MRVLSIGLLYPPHHLGGYELVCEGVTSAALARGHDVRVLVCDHRMPGVTATDEPLVRRELRSYLDPSAHRLATLDLRQRLALERHNGEVLERHLQEFAPDVVSWWAMGGMSLSLIERVRRAGLPAVLAIHDTWPIYAMRDYAWARTMRRLRIERLAPLLEPLCGGVPLRIELGAAGRFLFNSTYTRDAIAEGGLRAPDGAVLSPGVSARYMPIPERPSWTARLLYVGRLDPVKGVDLTLSALAQLPAQTTLRIVGSGSPAYESELRDLAASLRLTERVELAGSAEVSELQAVYADADAVLFPVRWQEPWGLVPLEAMAVGRPVIATAMGGAATYLRHEQNALVVPPDDPHALADAVRRLAGDPDLRRRLREGGMRTAAEHSAARYEQRFVDELERAARVL